MRKKVMSYDQEKQNRKYEETNLNFKLSSLKHETSQ